MTRSVGSNGYATIKFGGKPILAHRASWELVNGPIKSKLFVCHHCDVRNCVNPDHLFLGSNLDNVRDAVRKGRNSKPPRMPRSGELNTGAKLTAPAVLSIRKDARPLMVIAAEYGVSGPTISMIRNRRTWKHI